MKYSFATSSANTSINWRIITVPSFTHSEVFLTFDLYPIVPFELYEAK